MGSSRGKVGHHMYNKAEQEQWHKAQQRKSTSPFLRSRREEKWGLLLGNRHTQTTLGTDLILSKPGQVIVTTPAMNNIIRSRHQRGPIILQDQTGDKSRTPVYVRLEPLNNAEQSGLFPLQAAPTRAGKPALLRNAGWKARPPAKCGLESPPS